MKKFLNTMLITAAVVSAASVVSASTGAKVAQGAYLGASAGAANTNVKHERVASGKMTGGGVAGAAIVGSNVATETNILKSDAGKTAGLFGLIAGYNFQSGSLVFGGEIYGGLDSTKVNVSNDTASGASADSAAYGSLTVKRTNFMGFAPRLGFMVAPNTLMYARLGVEFGKWKATSTPNSQGLAAQKTTFTVSTANNLLSDMTFSASKGGMSFAPGLGMEVYMGKAFVRAQYSYLFGPKITLTQDMRGNAMYNGEFAVHTLKTSQHKVELAVGYKF